VEVNEFFHKTDEKELRSKILNWFELN